RHAAARRVAGEGGPTVVPVDGMNAPPRLVAAPISPWSERARWALDHHGITYRTLVHMPVIDERRLRRLAGNPAGRVTAPLPLDGDTVRRESWDIALYADRVGGASALIPAERADEVRRWVQLADDIAGEGRALVTAALLASPEALDETLPAEVPAW